jgi:hypothetical protein
MDGYDGWIDMMDSIQSPEYYIRSFVAWELGAQSRRDARLDARSKVSDFPFLI